MEEALRMTRAKNTRVKQVIPALVSRLNDRSLVEQVLNKNKKVCAKVEKGVEKDDDGEDDCVILDDDECVILDGDPFEAVKVVNNGIGNDDEELVIVAEKGQVACRDYPHPRHLCARFPFNTNAHEKHCDLCHCYVCDTRAPCVYWGTGGSGGDHCHSTDKEKTWREQRECFKQGKMAQLPASKHHEITPPEAPTPHPTPTPSQPLNSGNVSIHTNSCSNTPRAFSNEGRDVLSLRSMVLDRPRVQGERLTGTVKWFSHRGFGFITPSSGGEDVFVHYSSIKSKGCRSLSPDEDVEFQIETGDDGRDKAVDVSVLGRDDGGGCTNSGSCNPLVQGERLTGTVKWFNSQRGYGFITPSSGGEDVFVHYSSIKSKGFRSLSPDEDVEFHIETGDDGRDKAVDVSVLGQDDGGASTSSGSCNRGTTRRFNRSGGGCCYQCGGEGHFVKECPNLEFQIETGDDWWEAVDVSVLGPDDGGGYTNSGSCNQGTTRRFNTSGVGCCYQCGGEGHFARACPIEISNIAMN